MHAVKTVWDESRLLQPIELQHAIDTVVQCVSASLAVPLTCHVTALLQHAGGRAFVRPSGTEDCVRVYVLRAFPRDMFVTS